MTNFEQIADIMHEIACTSSTLGKHSILQKNKDNNMLKEILKYIYDPGFTTGLKAAKLGTWMHLVAPCDVYETMHYLRKHNTGQHADISVAKSFIEEQDTENARWLATGLVTKDLQIGVTATTLNKVYGKDFIPKIGIMRGVKYEDGMLTTPHIVTEKIDGNRRIIIVDDKCNVSIYTRSGKPDNTLVEIAKEAALLPPGYVYDSEVVKDGEFNDSIELRIATASALSRGDKAKRGLRALVFDMIPLAEYAEGRSKMGARYRKSMLATVLGDDNDLHVLGVGKSVAELISATLNKTFWVAAKDRIISLPILGVTINPEEVFELARPIWAKGFEGVMCAAINGAYEVSATPRKSLVKVKHVETHKLKVTGVYEGDKGFTGILGGIYVDYKGYTVGAGSGFTLEERIHYWENPDDIIGETVEIDCFGESRNQQGGLSLNCPIFNKVVTCDE